MLESLAPSSTRVRVPSALTSRRELGDVAPEKAVAEPDPASVRRPLDVENLVRALVALAGAAAEEPRRGEPVQAAARRAGATPARRSSLPVAYASCFPSGDHANERAANPVRRDVKLGCTTTTSPSLPSPAT